MRGRAGPPRRPSNPETMRRRRRYRGRCELPPSPRAIRSFRHTGVTHPGAFPEHQKRHSQETAQRRQASK
eukprot:4732280-Pyramimonas_sp.AAC.1